MKYRVVIIALSLSMIVPMIITPAYADNIEGKTSGVSSEQSQLFK